MNPARKRIFLELIDGLWAEEVLRDRGGSLSPAQLYALILMKTGDKAKAEDAWAERNAAIMRAGGTAEALP